jgi:hypothetical protein
LAEQERIQAKEDEKEKKEADEKARLIAADKAKPKPVGPKPFIRRLVFDFFAYSRSHNTFSNTWINPTIHSTFGIKESTVSLKNRNADSKSFNFYMSFYAPPSKVSKVLIQKDGEEGGYITEFYLKYRPQGSSSTICYNDCKPIPTNIKEEDEISKVHSFTLDTFATSGMIQMFTNAEDGKSCAGRFDFVIQPTVPIPPKYFPKVVSMFKDRSDQIESIKVSSSKDANYNSKFDLNSKYGFGAEKAGDALDIDVVFKTPQQVNGITVRQPNSKKEFLEVESVGVYTKDREDGSWRGRGSPMMIAFFKDQSPKFELRKKVFGAPWTKYVRVTVNRRGDKSLPVGGKFDLMLANVSE